MYRNVRRTHHVIQRIEPEPVASERQAAPAFGAPLPSSDPPLERRSRVTESIVVPTGFAS
jgi:hypothetical protein